MKIRRRETKKKTKRKEKGNLSYLLYLKVVGFTNNRSANGLNVRKSRT